MEKRWIVREQETERAATLARSLGVSQIIAGLLIARGYDDDDTAREFLQSSSSQLHDPSLMLGTKESHLKPEWREWTTGRSKRSPGVEWKSSASERFNRARASNSFTQSSPTHGAELEVAG